MKKIILSIAIVALLGSCKKDVTCYCTIDNTVKTGNIVNQNINSKVFKTSKHNSKKECIDDYDQTTKFNYITDTSGVIRNYKVIIINKKTCSIKYK